MKDIQILKLLNGEELIAEVIPFNGVVPTHVLLKNIFKIVVIPAMTRDQEPRVGLAPWTSAFSEDKEFKLAKDHITCIMAPMKEFMTEYNKQTSSIETVAAPPLII